MYQQTSRNIYIYIHFSYITCDDDNTYMWCVYNVLCMCVCVCVSWSHIYIQTIFLLLIILCPFITFIWDLQKNAKQKRDISHILLHYLQPHFLFFWYHAIFIIDSPVTTSQYYYYQDSGCFEGIIMIHAHTNHYFFVLVSGFSIFCNFGF